MITVSHPTFSVELELWLLLRLGFGCDNMLGLIGKKSHKDRSMKHHLLTGLDPEILGSKPVIFNISDQNTTKHSCFQSFGLF